MKMAVSNLAWDAADDEQVYGYLQKCGFHGLEVAPTRLISSRPYEKPALAEQFGRQLEEKYGIEVCSLQSIIYGRKERLFGPPEEREALLAYIMQAVDFAKVLSCGNLVFGAPGNRVIDDPAQYGLAVEFFSRLGRYACQQGTVLSIEANPAIYNTNFINTTAEALALVKEVDNQGLR